MKLFKAIMMACLSLAMSCTRQEPSFLAEEYDRTLLTEYQSIRDTAPNTLLYESMVVLDSLTSDYYHICEFYNVYRDGDQFTFASHYPQCPTYIDHFEDVRNEQVAFSPDTLGITLEKVIDIIRRREIRNQGPDIYISLYALNGEEPTSPFYTVECADELFFVDAMTGEVEVLESEE